MPRYDLSRAVWRTSSYSGQNGACVEVAVIGLADQYLQRTER